MSDGKRWEHGSEFHWLDLIPTDETAVPLPERAVLFGTGRHCLGAIAEELRSRVVHVPDYFCADVSRYLQNVGVEVRSYPDAPNLPYQAPETRSGDAVVIVNQFGIRQLSGEAERLRNAGVLVIEDHTHGPSSGWARRSTADFCIASLRKTLPVPDGAMLWSPAGRPLPDAPPLHPAHEKAAHQKLSAMLLKRAYLDGCQVDKAGFRDLAVSGERGMQSAEPSGPCVLTRALLEAQPWPGWSTARASNFHEFCSQVGYGVEVLGRDLPEAPLACIVVAPDAKVRNEWRAALIQQAIYPAVLWNLDDGPVPAYEASRDLSARTLVIHSDGRYSHTDMRVVADAVARLAGAG